MSSSKFECKRPEKKNERETNGKLKKVLAFFLRLCYYS